MRNKQIQGHIDFKENQQFRQAWFWILMISPLLSVIGILIFFASSKDANKVESLVALPIVGALQLVVMYVIYILRFEILVTDVAVYYRWWPFIRKYSRITPAEIEKVNVKKRPFLQIGHKRMVWGYGRVHNLGAPKGLHFILKSGRRIYIGSRKIQGFQRAVEKLIPVSTK